MKQLDILYTSDENYLTIMLASILSVIKNSNVKDLTFHIVTTKLSDNSKIKLNTFINKYQNNNITFYKYELDESKIEKYNITKWRGTNIANARLFFNDIITKNIKGNKLLYLDSDTLTISNYDELENYKDKNLCLVCEEQKIIDSRSLGLDKYYNSGVILVDVNNWNNKNYQERIIKEINKNKDYLYPDQDILNLALHDEITPLHPKYNVRPYPKLFNEKELYYYYKNRRVSLPIIKEARDNTVIEHGCGLGSIKPWSNNTINPFNEDYIQYILEVDPNFEKIDLNKAQKLFNDHPKLAKNFLIIRSYFPDELDNLISKISLNIQGTTSKKVSNKRKILIK